MNWKLYFALSMAVLAAAVVSAFAISRNDRRRGRILTPMNLLFGGLFLSVLLIFCPIYLQTVGEDPFRGLKAVLLSIHSTFQVFTLDSDRAVVLELIDMEERWIREAYSCFLSISYVLGPVLTFGFVITFFRNASAYIRYLVGFFRDAYVFSELNDRSIVLAGSIRQNHPHATIVFTDVFSEDGEAQYERITQAGEIRAVCFKKDILSVNFDRRLPGKELCFFTIGEDETENLEQSLALIRRFRSRPHTSLYVFSTRVDGELLLNSVDRGAVRVRRINEIRAQVNRFLFEHGTELFESALPGQEGEDKRIHAVLVGLGRQGTETLKSLSWYCQMDGYRFRADAFDQDPLAEDRFCFLCPELMDPAYNGKTVPGEAAYEICIHSGISVETKTFADEIRRLENPTYVFVALGNDALNLRVAVELRTLFEQMRVKPVIYTVLHSTEEKNALEGISNFRGQSYDIHFLGDLVSSYSESVIMDSDLEKEALQRHLRWGKEDDFWRFEYNYQSSAAAALHLRARISCGIPGAEKSGEEMEPAERETYEKLEHRRWNAYMRSEGYIFSGSKDKSSRNDLGKMHHDLVDYSSLTEEEKRKDSCVGTRAKQ